jgi:hypothetical protein
MIDLINLKDFVKFVLLYSKFKMHCRYNRVQNTNKYKYKYK